MDHLPEDIGDNIVQFPTQHSKSCRIINEIKNLFESGQAKGHIILILTHDDEIIHTWAGDLTKEEMIRMCSLGISEAYRLEDN